MGKAQSEPSNQIVAPLGKTHSEASTCFPIKLSFSFGKRTLSIQFMISNQILVSLGKTPPEHPTHDSGTLFTQFSIYFWTRKVPHTINTMVFDFSMMLTRAPREAKGSGFGVFPLYDYRREGTASLRKAVRDSRVGLTLHGAFACGWRRT